jgi:hypothetical protein
MKGISRWFGRAILAYVFLVVVYHLLPKYDFLQVGSSSVIGVYRCNRITGRVTTATILPTRDKNYKTVSLIQEGNRITNLLVWDIFEKYGSIEDK